MDAPPADPCPRDGADARRCILQDTRAHMSRLAAALRDAREQYSEAREMARQHAAVPALGAAAAPLPVQEHVRRDLVGSRQRRGRKIFNWGKTEYFQSLCRSLAEKLYLSMHYRALRTYGEMCICLRLCANRCCALQEHRLMRQCFDAIGEEGKRSCSTQKGSLTFFRFWALDRGFRSLKRYLGDHGVCLTAVDQLYERRLLRRGLDAWREKSARRRVGTGHDWKQAFSEQLVRRRAERISRKKERALEHSPSASVPQCHADYVSSESTLSSVARSVSSAGDTKRPLRWLETSLRSDHGAEAGPREDSVHPNTPMSPERALDSHTVAHESEDSSDAKGGLDTSNGFEGSELTSPHSASYTSASPISIDAEVLQQNRPIGPISSSNTCDSASSHEGGACGSVNSSSRHNAASLDEGAASGGAPPADRRPSASSSSTSSRVSGRSDHSIHEPAYAGLSTSTSVEETVAPIALLDAVSPVAAVHNSPLGIHSKTNSAAVTAGFTERTGVEISLEYSASGRATGDISPAQSPCLPLGDEGRGLNLSPRESVGAVSDTTGPQTAFNVADSSCGSMDSLEHSPVSLQGPCSTMRGGGGSGVSDESSGSVSKLGSTVSDYVCPVGTRISSSSDSRTSENSNIEAAAANSGTDDGFSVSRGGDRAAIKKTESLIRDRSPEFVSHCPSTSSLLVDASLSETSVPQLNSGFSNPMNSTISFSESENYSSYRSFTESYPGDCGTAKSFCSENSGTPSFVSSLNAFATARALHAPYSEESKDYSNVNSILDSPRNCTEISLSFESPSSAEVTPCGCSGSTAMSSLTSPGKYVKTAESLGTNSVESLEEVSISPQFDSCFNNSIPCVESNASDVDIVVDVSYKVSSYDRSVENSRDVARTESSVYTPDVRRNTCLERDKGAIGINNSEISLQESSQVDMTDSTFARSRRTESSSISRENIRDFPLYLAYVNPPPNSPHAAADIIRDMINTTPHDAGLLQSGPGGASADSLCEDLSPVFAKREEEFLLTKHDKSAYLEKNWPDLPPSAAAERDQSKLRQERARLPLFIRRFFFCWSQYIFVDRHKVYKLSYYLQQKRHRVMIKYMFDWRLRVKNTKLLRRVFDTALRLFKLRAELTCTDYRLLKYVMFGWKEVACHVKLHRQQKEKSRRALLFRGLSLMSKSFHAWARRASRSRRKQEANERYIMLLHRTSFFLWAAASKVGAKRRRKAKLMRPHRLLAEVLSQWYEVVHTQCVDLPLRCISRLRLRNLWDHWRTLNRSLAAKNEVTELSKWRTKRTALFFTQWKAVYTRKIRIREACDRLLLCKERYLKRCFLTRWEGWEQERSAQLLFEKISLQRQKPIAAETVNGPLMQSWGQHILEWRWREDGAFKEEMDRYMYEDEKENGLAALAPTPLDSESSERINVPSSLDYLLSTKTGVACTAAVETYQNSPTCVSHPSEKQSQTITDRGPRLLRPARGQKKSTTSTREQKTSAIAVCHKSSKKTKSSRHKRNPILDRALLLGYCGYRVESHAPLIRCIKTIFRAFRQIVQKRRHCQKAYLYYRNNRHYGSLSAVFHFWMSKVPELSHRSTSWLYPCERAAKDCSNDSPVADDSVL